MRINKKIKTLIKHGAEVSPFLVRETDDGKAIVEVSLGKTENLYSNLSPSPNRYIDEDIAQYMRKRMQEIPLKKEAEIHIEINENEPEIQKRQASTALKNFAYLKYKAARQNANKHFLSGLILTTMAALFFTFILIFHLREINDVVKLFSDIFLWLFVWEAFIILFLEYPIKRRTYLVYANMYVSQIRFYICKKSTNVKKGLDNKNDIIQKEIVYSSVDTIGIDTNKELN